MKGSIDGLVEAGVIVDDSAKHLSYTLYYEWGDGVTENETIIDIKVVKMIGPNQQCVLCEKEFEGHGNNAQPIKEGKCCDSCNAKVIATRLDELHKKVYGD